MLSFRRPFLLTLLFVAISFCNSESEEQSVQETFASNVLFDGSLGSLPERQGWGSLTYPLIGSGVVREIMDDRFVLDTMADAAIQSGIFMLTSQLPEPVALDRVSGFTIDMNLQVESEDHSRENRAGCSLLILSRDRLGIELGFWEGEVFAQSTRFEDAERASLPMEEEESSYRLDIESGGYRLVHEEQTLLEGPLRDYSLNGPPYTLANFIFLGDNTRSAAARTAVSRIELRRAEPSDPQTDEEEPESDPDEFFRLPEGFQRVTLAVDPEESDVSVSGEAIGIPIQPQGPGSLAASYSGTIEAIVGPTSIEIIGVGGMKAANSGNWKPGLNGADSSPAAYGAAAKVLFASAEAAARNIEVGIQSPSIEISDGEFDSTRLIAFFPDDGNASLDFEIRGLADQSGSESLAGLLATNSADEPATLASDQRGIVLTIPIAARFDVELFSEGDAQLFFEGRIVARQIQEIQSRISPIVVLESNAFLLKWPAKPGEIYDIQATVDFVDWYEITSGLTWKESEEFIEWQGEMDPPFQFYRLIRR